MNFARGYSERNSGLRGQPSRPWALPLSREAPWSLFGYQSNDHEVALVFVGKPHYKGGGLCYGEAGCVPPFMSFGEREDGRTEEKGVAHEARQPALR